MKALVELLLVIAVFWGIMHVGAIKRTARAADDCRMDGGDWTHYVIAHECRSKSTKPVATP